MIEEICQGITQEQLNYLLSVCQVKDKEKLQSWDSRNINIAKEMMLDNKSREEIEVLLYVEKSELFGDLELEVCRATLSSLGLDDKDNYSLAEAYNFLEARELVAQGWDYELLPLVSNREDFEHLLAVISIKTKNNYSERDKQKVLNAYKLKLQGTSDEEIAKEFSKKGSNNSKGDGLRDRPKSNKLLNLDALSQFLADELGMPFNLEGTFNLLQKLNWEIKTSYTQEEAEAICKSASNSSAVGENLVSNLLSSAKNQAVIRQFAIEAGRAVGLDLASTFSESMLKSLSQGVQDNPIIAQVNRELQAVLEGKSDLLNGREYLITEITPNSSNLLPPSDES